MWGDFEARWWRVAVECLYDLRNWGLSINVRWYPSKCGRLPVVVSAQVGPLAGSVYLGT